MKRPINVQDLYRIITVEDPQISPDGQWIAFVRVTLDKMENGYKRTIWLRSTQDETLIQLTRSGKDSHPRWSPDGSSLLFVSSRDEKPQVYVLSVTAPGGEAHSVTQMQNGAFEAEWSPDGQSIAFLSASTMEELETEDNESNEKDEKDEPKDKLEAKHRKERRDQEEKERLDPYFMWRVPYRVGTSFLDERYTQVYMRPVADDEAKPRRLTTEKANHETPKWSPDGKYLYTARQIDPLQDEPFRSSALYRIALDSGEIKQLTDDSHSSFGPTPSPDGKWVAYVRLPKMTGSLTDSNPRLTVMPVEGGEPRDLNIELDRSVVDFGWMNDSSGLIFTADSYGIAPIHQVSVNGGAVETLATGYLTKAISVGQDNAVVAVVCTPTNPSELYFMPAGGNELKPVTELNKAFLDEIVVQETHEFRFKNPHGQEIQGWYILPVGYEEGQKYPLALNIHGGPHVMWSSSEPSMFHEWQFHAASGYAVFYCNPRGGDGYGEAFQQALHSAWGDVAFEDIMAGVDAFLEKGIVDEQRMAVTGGSYGGYMTAWMVGHTDRFASAVTQRGVYNLISFYGTSDIPMLISGEFDVEPWEDHEKLWKHSPLAYAHNIKTPLFIIHSENDFRVPIEQGEQLFAFVRRSGGTVEMWRYPRDGHELSRSGEPEHRVSRLTKMVEWFDKYCKTDN